MKCIEYKDEMYIYTKVPHYRL